MQLRYRSRLVAAALVAAALAATGAFVVPRTLGFFDATTTNPGNSFSAGTLTMTNSSANSAIVTLSNMKPGDATAASPTGDVTITNSGSLAARMSLTEAVTAAGAGTPAFAHDLQLTITDTTNSNFGSTGCNASNVIYSGAFDSVGTITFLRNSLGCVASWNAGEAHTYHFQVTFPDSGSSSDNQYQGTTATATLSWQGSQQ
jgi:hypothetical protein